MAITMTFGIQKGGVGKSTTSGIMAYLLGQEDFKVLCIDMDSQGNLTDLMTQQDPEYFEDKTVLDAIYEKDIKPYIYKVNENIHIVPADDFLAGLPRLIYTKMKADDPALHLRDLLEPVQDDYDFIIIDTPPSLGEHMVNAICAADYVVCMASSAKWAMTAIPRFKATIDTANSTKDLDIKFIGILRTMNDVRRSDSRAFVELIEAEYPELVFNTVITQKAATGRLSIGGFDANNELNEAIKLYKDFYGELMDRVVKG